MRLLTLSAITVLVLTACNLGTTSPNTSIKLQATPTLILVSTIELTVQADTSVPFTTVGQVINFSLTIKNKGATGLPGPVTITGATVTCPGINTIGNLDALLDVNETLICTGAYAITQADLDRGSVTNVTTANVNGILSNQVTTTVATVPNKALTLTKTANPLTYDRIGQTITYTYTIKNSGSTILGPAQFTVSDTGLGAPFNCGDANTTLAPNLTMTCFATYVITQADLNAASVITNATASGGGAGPSQPVSATVAKTVVAQITPTTSSNLTPGSTVPHTVVAGEWLWQIARCYGANPNEVIQANPQLGNPARISPGDKLSVPHVGSAGPIYGTPCVVTHTVQAGDTWSSIAQKYNADVTVLQMVNPVTLSAGTVLKVPRNSAGGTAAAPTSDAFRISFATGATSATQNGTALSGNRPVHYVLNARQGQVMTVKLTAPANSISLAIYAPNGSTVKPLDLNLTWSGTLPADGDYRLDVFNALGLGASDVPYTLEVSVAGNCVDLSRTLKTLGITHFNICGQTDAAGRAKISVIHIFQRPEDVPLGGLLQDINVTIETSTPLNDPNSLVVGDMNYDGFDDFRIIKNLPAGPNIPYLYYLYVPTTRQFVYSEAYANITSPEFIGNSQIRSQWRESAAKWGIDTYTITNNIPKLTQRETWEALNATQVTHRIIVFDANGTSQVILDEVIPMP